MELYEMGLPVRWQRALYRAALERVHEVEAPVMGCTTQGAEFTNDLVAKAGGRTYATRLLVNSRGVLVGCECPAGEAAVPCKHLARVLDREGFLEALHLAA